MRFYIYAGVEANPVVGIIRCMLGDRYFCTRLLHSTRHYVSEMLQENEGEVHKFDIFFRIISSKNSHFSVKINSP